MAQFDISKLSPEARGTLLKTGRLYNSSATLAQADRILKMVEVYKSEMASCGFTQNEIDLLKDARDQLIKAGVSREGARTQGKTVTQSAVDALHQAKSLREKVRAFLSVMISSLSLTADANLKETLRQVEMAVKHTQGAHGDADKLVTQLLQLKDVCEQKALQEALKARSGTGLAGELKDMAETLRTRASATQTPKGTKEHTETLDIIDGFIVHIARNARKSARAAAKLGNHPALADAFELTELRPPVSPAPEKAPPTK